MRLIGSVAAAGALLAARQFYRNWGTTKEECQTPLPGDELIGQPAVQTTEGVWIDAPAADVWPWLVQMGQDRGGLYSYEGLENAVGLKYRNADRIHPEWQHLEAGDVIRVVPRGWMGLSEGIALPVAQVIGGESIVLRLQPPQLPFDGVWSFHVIPRWEDRCRLLVRSRTRMQAPGEVLGAEAAGPVLALMTRGMLLGIKRRVEANRSTG
ncbi:MAG TPA: SRPBCC family protein [Mycobacterium sp.]|nr:SRPBCC family protein [Mycobacterium sp.]